MRRLVCAALVLAALLGGCSLGEEETRPPQLGVQAEDEEAAETSSARAPRRRATRFAWAEATRRRTPPAWPAPSTPATGDSDRPTAVALVEQDDWITGISASRLTGPPIGAPIPLDGDEPLSVTEDVLERLDPQGPTVFPRTPR